MYVSPISFEVWSSHCRVVVLQSCSLVTSRPQERTDELQRALARIQMLVVCASKYNQANLFMIVSDKEKIDAMELLHAVTLFTTSLTSVNTVATKVYHHTSVRICWTHPSQLVQSGTPAR